MYGTQFCRGKVCSSMVNLWQSSVASITELFDLEVDETCIFYDNLSCITLSVNPVCHDKSKHIEIKYHYIQEMIQKGVVKLHYVPSDEQVEDVLTKPLSREKFEYFRDELGMVKKNFPS